MAEVIMDRVRWLEALTEEDAMFLKRFVLASGSLKELAAEYGISYPTVRLRLDRLIEKIKLYDSLEIRSGFERRLRVLCAEGKVDLGTMKQILQAHQEEIQKQEGKSP